MIPGSPSVVDFQGLAQLRLGASEGSPEALEEAAQQFESLIIGLMLKTARDAQLGDGLFDNSQSKQYLELMDQQVALELARKGGFGFSDMIVEQLSAAAPVPPHKAESFEANGAAAFVRALLPQAEAASRRLGVDPKLLLAQAALETGWGRSLPKRVDGSSSNNLFGIKAGDSWRGPSVAQWTLENVDGAVTRQRAQFRAYSSAADSFDDYAALIAESPRYARALDAGAESSSYVREVVAGGYATDPDYADKWLSIYRGELLRDAVQAAQGTGIAADTMAASAGD